jgi:crossover junction endodeoxyribonuclease RuvC
LHCCPITFDARLYVRAADITSYLFLVDKTEPDSYMNYMRVLGIDPGLNITGYGIVESDGALPVIVEAGIIRTREKTAMEDRLLEIAHELTVIIEQFKPDAVAVENLYSHYNHPKTAITMGHARGIIFLKAAEANLQVFPYAATRIKKSLTGNGRASKRQMQLMICSTFGLKKVPEPPDIADALAAALCHCRAMIKKRTALV